MQESRKDDGGSCGRPFLVPAFLLSLFTSSFMPPDFYSLSIIIPCRNDATALAETLPQIMAGLLPGDEVIVADFSADEASTVVARQHGVIVVRCEKPGRGSQMRDGAAAAQGNVLVFSHADTQLSAAHLAAIRTHLTHLPDIPAGAFFKDIPAHYPAWAWANPLVRWWMGKWGVVYGDQSVFLRREFYDAVGGMPALPIMEDVALSRKLRRAPGFRLIDPPLRTSLRRFARRGRFWTRLQNIFYVLLFRCGVPAERLYRWYYGKPVDAPDPRS